MTKAWGRCWRNSTASSTVLTKVMLSASAAKANAAVVKARMTSMTTTTPVASAQVCMMLAQSS
jgi:hypothetical protein